MTKTLESLVAVHTHTHTSKLLVKDNKINIMMEKIVIKPNF